MTTLPDPDWYSLGVCHTAPNKDIFTPNRRNIGTEAKSYCRRCPATEECLRWALEHRLDGIWGGTTTSERRKLLLSRKAVARA